jgi:hypothetical protein
MGRLDADTEKQNRTARIGQAEQDSHIRSEEDN